MLESDAALLQTGIDHSLVVDNLESKGCTTNLTVIVKHPALQKSDEVLQTVKADKSSASPFSISTPACLQAPLIQAIPRRKKFCALYLFAGLKRKSDIGQFLRKLQWHVEELDILRDKSHDLTMEKVSQKVLQRVRAGEFTAVLASPPCDTYSRVKWANDLGPRPTRSFEYPRGFDWLLGDSKLKTQLANTLTDVTFAILDAQAALSPGLIVLEFPEDLGAIQSGKHYGRRPGSIWQWPQFKALLEYKDILTMGIRQSDFEAQYVKPTRLTLKHVPSSGVWFAGPPCFDPLGFYAGPIPKTNTAALGLQTLAKRPGDQGFRTTGTAAWPAALNLWLANGLNDAAVAWEATYVAGEGVCTAGSASVALASVGEEEFPTVVPPENFWVGGRGPPRTTYVLGKTSLFHDGAGLTSPGRWEKHFRKFPEGKRWQLLREGLLRCLSTSLDKSGKELGSGGIQRLLLVLACTPQEDFLTPQCIDDGRKVIKEWLGKQCSDFDQTEPDIAVGQPFLLHAIHHLLREMRDADYMVIATMKVGVTAGILFPLPRTPALFEKQEKWRLQEDPLIEGQRWGENYSSLGEHVEAVEELFRSEEKLGMMLEMPKKIFDEKYPLDRQAISPLAVLCEKNKLRVLHDATHVTRVNHRIRCRDKLRNPGIKEKHTQYREFRKAGSIPISILSDFSKAHRLLKILEEEWGMLACQLRPETVWINRVGTFGVGSAAYWWAKLAGALVRCVYGILGADWPLELLLYADDLEMAATSAREREAVVLAIYILVLLGSPLKNTKFRGGFQIDWVGLHLDNRTYSAGLSLSRAKWMCDWLRNKACDGRVGVREMAGGLGRLNFAATALFHERPWLGPLYLWVSAILRSSAETVVIPWAIRLIMDWIASRLDTPMRLMVTPPIPKTGCEMFRSDAKAEKGKAFIGSWECSGGRSASEARWFAAEITEEDFPWVFAKSNDPGRVIAALELLGSILSIIIFDIRPQEFTRCSCSITGATDNLGNSFAVSKMLSTKWPLTALVIELGEQLRDRGLDLQLAWIRRDLNQEADDLTNMVFSKFNLKLRIPFKACEIRWLVLDEVMAASKRIYDSVISEREARSIKDTKRKFVPVKVWQKKMKAKDRMRTANPW